MKKKYKIDFLYRPGLYLSNVEIYTLTRDLRKVAHNCFDEIPNYQCLSGTREELSDKIITIARTKNGDIVGFCSAVLFAVEGVGQVLHLGLTCVHPDHRGQKLTHQLSFKCLIHYVVRYRFFDKVWISNVACVLSSLGNVALHFEEVYPSPFRQPIVTQTHLKIAKAINLQYRDKIYISKDSTFDKENFVFRGSSRNNMFQKSKNDTQYYHRNNIINHFYIDLMNFENGDEVLQIGNFSMLTGIKYFKNKKVLPARLSVNSTTPINIPIADLPAEANFISNNYK